MQTSVHSNEGNTASQKGKKKAAKRQYNFKNANRPKRPLSAYNLFFRSERDRIIKEALSTGESDGENKSSEEVKISSPNLTRSGKRVHRKTHGAIGFADLAKRISESWKNLDEVSRASFQSEADKLKEQYQLQLKPKKKSHSTINKQHTPPLFIHDPRNHGKVDNTNPGEDEKHNRKGQGITHNIDEGQLRQAFSNYESTRRHDFNGCVGNYHPSSSLNEDVDGAGSIQQKVTAPHAFSPPFPHQYQYTEDDQPLPISHKPPRRQEDSDDSQKKVESEPVNNEQKQQQQKQQQHGEAIDYAYQCEICVSAVFATYQECADHEEQCTGEHESMKTFKSGGAIIEKADVKEQNI